MTAPRLIGLSGYAGCGKDTAASLLADTHTRVAFADRVRAVAYDAQDTLRTLVDSAGWDRAKQYPFVRRQLQSLGMAVRTHVGPDAWVDAAFRDLLPSRSYVFTDVRFPNEAARIKAEGGVVLRIYRPGCIPVNGHESETALDDWPFDARIRNDGSPDLLHGRLRNVLWLV